MAVPGDVCEVLFASWFCRILGVVFVALSLSACGGGSGGGDDSTPILVPPVDPDPVEPVDPDPVEPVDLTEITADNIEDFFAAAKAVWKSHGSGGLPAVIAELEKQGNDPIYDIEQIEQFILDYKEYLDTAPTHFFGGEMTKNFAHPFTLTNVYKAWTAGLTGAGQLIAISEVPRVKEGNNGFDLSHPDLQVKPNIECLANEFTNCPTFQQDPKMDDHGTAVAVIAAGSVLGGELLGVAPQADLLLMLDTSTWTAEIALARGAVVLSNSWGSTDCGEYIWECRYWSVDDPPDISRYRQRVEAYDNFQESGVVIFSKPNVDIAVGPDWYSEPSDFPYFYEELREAWISVINARIELDGNGNVLRAIRDSSPCNLSAEWCLVGNGHVRYAMPGGGYSSGRGTSFVAPQVAGAVALLAEAFPDLSPADWTARLLASANNKWFLTDGQPGYDSAVPLADRCWNNDAVCHTYSLEWGHGVMDLEAALSPLGGLSLLGGNTVSTANRIALSNAVLTAPTGSMSALRQSLSVPLTTFDGLNGNFAIPARDLVEEQEASDTALTLLQRLKHSDAERSVNYSTGRFSMTVSQQVTDAGLPSEFEFQHISPDSGRFAGFGFTSRDSAAALGGLSTTFAANPIGFTGFLGETAYGMLGVANGELGQFSLYGFAGENRNDDEGRISGLGTRYGLQFGATKLEISTSLAMEEGSYLGIDGNDELWFGGTTSVVAGHLAFQHDLGDGLSLFSRLEIGSADGGEGAAGTSLISTMETSLYSGFELGLKQSGLLTDEDQLSLWISQPMRVESSGMTLHLPSGRTKDGKLLYEDHGADLTPQDRQIDVGLSYAIGWPERNASFQVGLMHSFNEGHVAGQNATAIAARHAIRF